MLRLIFIMLLGVTAFGFSGATKTDRLRNKALEAKNYSEENNMNTNVCVLIDMSIHSGKKRLILWDFNGDSVITSAVCSHGACDNLLNLDELKEPNFSNKPESHCSSKGKYKIGKRGYSSWGVHFNYKLHGLEKTNTNAYKRYIVFHSWGAIEDKEIYPRKLAQSWGCPAVSNNFMKEIDAKLKKQEGSVLLWIYD